MNRTVLRVSPLHMVRKWIWSKMILLLAVRFSVYFHVKSALSLGVCMQKQNWNMAIDQVLIYSQVGRAYFLQTAFSPVSELKLWWSNWTVLFACALSTSVLLVWTLWRNTSLRPRVYRHGMAWHGVAWHETIKHMQLACSASKKASSHSQALNEFFLFFLIAAATLTFLLLSIVYAHWFMVQI